MNYEEFLLFKLSNNIDFNDDCKTENFIYKYNPNMDVIKKIININNCSTIIEACNFELPEYLLNKYYKYFYEYTRQFICEKYKSLSECYLINHYKDFRIITIARYQTFSSNVIRNNLKYIINDFNDLELIILNYSHIDDDLLLKFLKLDNNRINQFICAYQKLSLDFIANNKILLKPYSRFLMKYQKHLNSKKLKSIFI